MTAQLSNGHGCLEGVVQVQKPAPVDLLIGTDVQPQLGFLFLESGQDATATNLLDGKRWNVSEAQSQPVTEQPQEDSLPAEAAEEGRNEAPVVVSLIQATRLPARHSKLVRAHVDCRSVKAFTLFQPENETLERRGLQMEDGAAEADEGGFPTLAIQNHSLGPVHLKKGEILGALHQAEVWDTLVCPEKAEVKTIPGTVAAITGSQAPAKDGDGDLAARQGADPELHQYIEYLGKGTLPADDGEARKIALNRPNYALLDGVLFHMEPDKTLCIIPPRS